MATIIKKSLLVFVVFLMTVALRQAPLAGAASTTSTAAIIGITYRSITSPAATPPEKIGSAVQKLRIAALRLTDSDPAVVRAFSNRNTRLFLCVKNSLVAEMSANRSSASRWLYQHVVPFHDTTRISIISVGSDLAFDFQRYLVPAMRNLRLALDDLGINTIAVSTTYSFVKVMTTAFPPSTAKFSEESGVLEVLDFLSQTNAPFLVKIYPYNAYHMEAEIPMGFAMFQKSDAYFREDRNTRLRYWNLFDMMADAVISAMTVSGHGNISLVVAETGWPSSGGDLTDATEEYAQMYLNGLVKHLRSGLGTPLRKEGVAETFVFELLDKEATAHDLPRWGILRSDLKIKYSLDLSGAGGNLSSCVLYLLMISSTALFCTCVFF